MKISELIEDKELSEVPASGVGQLAKKVGAKVLNKIPSSRAKSKAANIAGKVDLGATANLIHRQFSNFLGTQGKKISQASGQDLKQYLKTKGHQTTVTIPDGELQKKNLNSIITNLAKEALAGKGSSAPASDKPASAAAGDANNNGTPDSKEVTFAPNQKVLFVSKAGIATAAVVIGKSLDGDESKVAVQGAKGQKFNIPRDKLIDPKTKKPFKPGQKPDTASSKGKVSNSGIPPKLQKQIDTLSPEQKKELVSLL